MKVAVFSVVPSPYQRDLFSALARRPEIDLSVFYLEAASPDSPWPEKALAPYERVLPGFWFPLGAARCHVNWPLPPLRDFDAVICNTLLTAVTGQWLMRVALRRKPWLFWGEKLGGGGRLYAALTAPLHRATAIVGIGTWAQREYQARFPGPRHFCLPYHCALAEFLRLPRPRPRDGRLVFLFCGQMIARKGLDLLLTAFAEVAGTHPHVDLLLVGREADLPDLLAALPAAARKRIRYAGFQPPEELPRFFAQADVFVLPSRYDGWGVVVNQALGAGLPVVCSDQVGAGFDLVEEGVNGCRFPARNAAALADCLRRFAERPEMAEQFGAASRERAQDCLPERGAERWVEILRKTLAR